ncbi:arrestin domain-containing protein 3-like [Mya arenaria]|uniref:arrestin domain-containing protein 3-like n=1 Tax=Mya arenaria TaxID=6604 RepID=UPI0022E1FB55|nr:arrestin domain-containing protein 3-like [Mya arenaria]
MASLERLEVYLDGSPDHVFTTGETVHGRIMMVVGRSLKIQRLEVRVRGRCLAEWQEASEDGEERQLYEKEEYIRNSITVLGKVASTDGRTDTPHVEFVDSGTHVYSFQFQLPEDVPSSFEGVHGYVRYWVKAKLYGVWGLLDQSGRVEFNVEKPLDLNTIPGAMDPAEDEDSCVICGCCMNQGSVTASLRINKRGFVPGESIVCDASVLNGSETSIRATKIKFYKIITYGDSPLESVTREKTTICEVIRGKLKPGHEESFVSEYLLLPPSLPMTSLPGCSLIDVDYVIELKVVASQSKMSICLPLLIIVGSISTDENLLNDKSEGFEAITMQPLSTNHFKTEEASSDDRPISSIAPMATELDELYPPIRSQLSYINEESPEDENGTPSDQENELTVFSPLNEDIEAGATLGISIFQREKTLEEIYIMKRRPRVLKIMAAVNEGTTFDDENSL